VVRPRSCRVIYYFDTSALGRRHQFFGRVIRHVCFHENIFPFANSEQITHTPVPSTEPTHLPPLNPPQFYQPTTLPTGPNNIPILPSVAPQQTPHLPIAFAFASPPSSPAILSPATCFSNDHYAGTGSPLLDALAFRFDIAKHPVLQQLHRCLLHRPIPPPPLQPDCSSV
jgi:hypothetical protein